MKRLIGVNTIDAGDKTGVLRPRHIGVKAAGKTHGPRDGAIRVMCPASGCKVPAGIDSKLDLPAPLRPKGHRLPGGKGEIQVPRHGFLRAIKAEGFLHALQPYHRRSRRRCNRQARRWPTAGWQSQKDHAGQGDAAGIFSGFGQCGGNIGGKVAAFTLGLCPCIVIGGQGCDISRSANSRSTPRRSNSPNLME